MVQTSSIQHSYESQPRNLRGPTGSSISAIQKQQQIFPDRDIRLSYWDNRSKNSAEQAAETRDDIDKAIIAGIRGLDYESTEAQERRNRDKYYAVRQAQSLTQREKERIGQGAAVENHIPDGLHSSVAASSGKYQQTVDFQSNHIAVPIMVEFKDPKSDIMVDTGSFMQPR